MVMDMLLDWRLLLHIRLPLHWLLPGILLALRRWRLLRVLLLLYRWLLLLLLIVIVFAWLLVPVHLFHMIFLLIWFYDKTLFAEQKKPASGKLCSIMLHSL